MRHFKPLACVLVWFVISVAAGPFQETVQGQEPQAPDALLKSDSMTTSIALGDTPPYRLHSKLTFLSGPLKGKQGEVTVLFASPSRWREDLSLNGATSVQWVVDGKNWRKNSDATRLEEMYLGRARNFQSWLTPWPNAKFALHKKGGSTCMLETLDRVMPGTYKLAHYERQICTNADGLPTSVGGGSEPAGFEFPGGYLPLGAKRYPSKIVYSQMNAKILEIDTDALASVDRISDADLQPATDAAALPWCLNEQAARIKQLAGVPRGSDDMMQPAADMSQGQSALTLNPDSVAIAAFSMVLFDVDSQGHVKSLFGYDKHGALVTASPKLKILSASTFEPAACGDQMVDADVMIEPPTDSLSQSLQR